MKVEVLSAGKPNERIQITLDLNDLRLLRMAEYEAVGRCTLTATSAEGITIFISTEPK